MVKKNFALILFFILCLNSAVTYAQEELNDYEYIKLGVENTIEFKTTMDSKYDVSKFEVISYFLPQSIADSQYVNSFDTSHNDYVIKNDSGILYLTYLYDKQTLQQNNIIDNNFVIESTMYRPEITEKIIYPVKNIDEEYEKYLLFYGLIDIDEEIKTQASKLAAGEDDVYVIATKIAKWIREDINYDLSTVTQNPNQKSTDVFESKAGVCKEITNLYVSMMRSIGIPARVATGYAYTTSQEVTEFVGSNWGGHAWAEVLIGDKWVPFDLTYNQYGYTDATHIIFDKSHESRNRNVMINASGYGFELVQNSLASKQEFTVIDKKKNIFDEGFDIELWGPTKVGLDSYGYIKVSAKNTEDFYNILFLRLAKTNEVQLLDSDEKMEIFQPGEEKEIYFRYKLNDLSSNYVYTLPFLIYNDFINIEYNVSAKNGYDEIGKSELPENEIRQTELSSNGLIFDCSFLIEMENNLVMCSVKNPNNYEIHNLNICIDDEECKVVDLKLNEMKSVTFKTYNFEEKISYLYDNEKGSFEISQDIPTLDYSYHNKPEEILFNYSIENYKSAMGVNLFLDDILVERSLKPSESFAINASAGNHSLSYELVMGDRVFENQTFDIEVEEIKPADDIRNFFEKIIDRIMNLFKNLN